MTITPNPVAQTQAGRLPALKENADFLRRMSEGWGVPDRAPRLTPGAAAAAAGHRERLSAAWPGTLLVVSAGAAMLRNDDEFFPFRADSNFLWLTGCSSPDAVLVMFPRAGGHDSVLFLTEPVTAAHPGYLSERERSELWMGGSPSLHEWSETLGVPVQSLEAMGTVLRKAAGQATRSAGRPSAASGLLDISPAFTPSAELARSLSELRLIKDDWEIGQLRYAVDATVEGFAAVAAELRRATEGGGERWLQGTFDRTARTLGNATGYRTIVAAGEHAPVLHWTRNDGPVRDGDLLLLDAGVETRTFYTSDVTRTFPISGSFSAPQRAVHDLVQAAHEAGIGAVRPGNTFTDFHHAAMAVIAEGLHDWGML
ncbi:MAG: aminopeptidase P family protein, partial [Cryobacterium sp.]